MPEKENSSLFTDEVRHSVSEKMIIKVKNISTVITQACKIFYSKKPKNIWDICGGTHLLSLRGISFFENGHKIEKLEKKETYKPLPDSLHIGKSKIHGQGLVASEDIPMGTDLGISHYRKGDDVIRTPLGGFINHSEDPSATRKQIRIEPYWDKWTVTTTKDITLAM